MVIRDSIALVAPYHPIPADGASPATDDRFTTAPPCSPIHASRHAFVHAIGASAFVSTIFPATPRSRSPYDRSFHQPRDHHLNRQTWAIIRRFSWCLWITRSPDRRRAPD